MERSKTLLAVMTIAFFLAGAAGVLAQGQGQSRKQSQHAIHDANGDGICDDCGQVIGSGQANAQGKQAKKGKHWGPADGSGNKGSGPQDGTGPYHQSGGQGRSQGQGAGGRGGRP